METLRSILEAHPDKVFYHIGGYRYTASELLHSSTDGYVDRPAYLQRGPVRCAVIVEIGPTTRHPLFIMEDPDEPDDHEPVLD